MEHGDKSNTDEQICGNGKISPFREILSQVLATTAKSTIILSLGTLLAFPSVIIPVLLNKHGEETLHIDLEQASWYGAMTFIFQPAGCLLSGALLQSFGCKNLMILLNLPTLACWIIPYFASSVFMLYVVSGLAGFVIGLMEAPTVRYIGEIAHPSLRSILTTYSQIYISVGGILVHFLGSLMYWRHVSLICASVPIICSIALIAVPETPMWLMSKGCSEEALKSLQWLRGWTSANNVKEEFYKLEIYAKKKKVEENLHGYTQEVDTRDEERPPSTQPAIKGEDPQNGAPREKIVLESSPKIGIDGKEYYQDRTFAEKWQDLTRHETIIAVLKCSLLFTASTSIGVIPVRPFIIRIYQLLRIPMDANRFSALLSMVHMVSTISFVFILKWVGKRRMLLSSSTLSALCLVLLGLLIRGFYASLVEDSVYGSSATGWSIISLFVLHSITGSPASAITWIYLSEILPFKGRGITTGVVVSYYYLIIFVAVKLYPTMEEGLGVHGIFLSYGVVSIVAISLMYFVIPETEGKFLADIESEFIHKSDKSNGKV